MSVSRCRTLPCKDSIKFSQELNELLGYNISLLTELDCLNAPSVYHMFVNSGKPLREIMLLPSWLCCFLAYAPLRCNDKDTRDRFSYTRIIMEEVQRHGGQSWLAYNGIFRQQADLDPLLCWNEFQPAILTSTLLSGLGSPVTGHGPSGRGNIFGSICREVDYTATTCTLSYRQQSATSTRIEATSYMKRSAIASHS